MTRSVLVLDDPAHSLGGLAEHLKEIGHRPTVLYRSAELLTDYDEIAPEAVLLSLRVANTPEICDFLRGTGAGALVPILMVGTGQEAVRSTNDAMQAGADCYFEHPLDLKAVTEKLETYIGAPAEGPGGLGDQAEVVSDASQRLLQSLGSPAAGPDKQAVLAAALEAPTVDVQTLENLAADAAALKDELDALEGDALGAEEAVETESAWDDFIGEDRQAEAAEPVEAESAPSAQPSHPDAPGARPSPVPASELEGERAATLVSEGFASLSEGLGDASNAPPPPAPMPLVFNRPLEPIVPESQTSDEPAPPAPESQTKPTEVEPEAEERAIAEEDAPAGAASASPRDGESPRVEVEEFRARAELPHVDPQGIADSVKSMLTPVIDRLKAQTENRIQRALQNIRSSELNQFAAKAVRTQSLAEVLIEAWRSGSFLRVHIEQPRPMSIALDGGRPTAFGLGSEARALVAYLIRRGLVARGAAEHADMLNGYKGSEIIRTLTQEGLLSAEDTSDILADFWLDTLMDVFALPALQIKHEEYRTSDLEEVDLALAPLDLLHEGLRRRYDAERLLTILGSGESYLQLRETTRNLVDEVQLSEDEKKAWDWLLEGRPLDEVVHMARIEKETVYRTAYLMMLGGVVDIHRRHPSFEERRLDPAAAAELILDKAEQVASAEYFDILGVAPTATAYELELAKRRLDRAFADDRFPPALRAQYSTQLRQVRRGIIEAYEVLRDPALREAYAQSQG